jgi:hypothetical protein
VDVVICQEIADEKPDVTLSALDCVVRDGTYNVAVVESDKVGETTKVQYTNLSSGDVFYSWERTQPGQAASYPDIHLGAGRESVRIDTWVVTHGKAKHFELTVWNQTGQICANEVPGDVSGGSNKRPNTPGTPSSPDTPNTASSPDMPGAPSTPNVSNRPAADTSALVIPRMLPRTADGDAPGLLGLILIAMVSVVGGGLLRYAVQRIRQ